MGAGITNIRMPNTLENWTFWNSDFQWFGLGTVDYSYSPNHPKTEPSEIWTKWLPFFSDFQWFWTKWPPFCSKWNDNWKTERMATIGILKLLGIPALTVYWNHNCTNKSIKQFIQIKGAITIMQCWSIFLKCKFSLRWNKQTITKTNFPFVTDRRSFRAFAPKQRQRRSRRSFCRLVLLDRTKPIERHPLESPTPCQTVRNYSQGMLTTLRFAQTMLSERC